MNGQTIGYSNGSARAVVDCSFVEQSLAVGMSCRCCIVRNQYTPSDTEGNPGCRRIDYRRAHSCSGLGTITC